eukprot:scaffold772_cov339-Pavlova_lutheri.AAC.43
MEELTPSKINARSRGNSAVHQAAMAAAACMVLKEVNRRKGEPQEKENTPKRPPGFDKEQFVDVDVDVDVDVELEGYEEQGQEQTTQPMQEERTPIKNALELEKENLHDGDSQDQGTKPLHPTPCKEGGGLHEEHPLRRSASPARPGANLNHPNHLRESQVNVRRSFQAWRDAPPNHYQSYGFRRSIDVGGRFRPRDHPLRASRASSIISGDEGGAYERVHCSSLNERMFQRELMDVHSEIDKLLGSLRAELEYWKSDFESLQTFWSELVQPGCAGSGDFCSLSEFMRELEMFLEDKAINEQRLEEQLITAEEDRSHLSMLLEEAEAEVKSIHIKESAFRTEKANLKAATKAAEMDRDGQISRLMEEVESLSAKLQKANADATAQHSQVHELQKALGMKEEELREVSQEKEDLAVDVQDFKDALTRRMEKLSAAETELKQAKTMIREKEKENEELRVSLGSNERELKFAEDALKQRENRIAETKQEVAAALKAKLDLKDELEAKSRAFELQEDKKYEVASQLESALSSQNALQSELANLRQQFKDAQKENECMSREVANLQEQLRTKSEELTCAHSALDKEVDAGAKLKDEMQVVSQNVQSLQEEISMKEAETESIKELNSALKAQMDELCSTRDAQESALREEARVLEEECHNLMLASQSSKAELEQSLRQKYEQMMADAEAHTEQMLADQVKKHQSEKEELQKQADARLQEEKAHFDETKSSMSLQFETRINELKAGFAARFGQQEKEFQKKMASELENMKALHEQEMQTCSEAADMRIKQEAEKRYKYESYLKQKVERAIQEHARALEADMSTRLRRFEEEQMAVCEVKKMVGSLSNLWEPTPKKAEEGDGSSPRD